MKKLHIRHKKSLDERISEGLGKEVKEVKREWRHVIKFKDENHLLFMAFVLLMAALVIINTVYVLNRGFSGHGSKATKTLITVDSGKYLTSQQTGSNDSETVSIKNVTENDRTDNAFTIDPSQTMLILSISITNTTEKSQQLIPVNQLYVKTSEGDYAALHASSYVTVPLGATELAPGKTAKGQISFAVPKHIANPLLYVDTGWNKNIPLVFDVLR
ncbi:hypothetical protein BH10PAT3_BH10PAT3_6630 [soil metagenome]